MGPKIRADKLLVELGIFESREKAREAISKGFVEINGKPVLKPSSLVDLNSQVKIIEEIKYVSRGGYKLEKALNLWSIELKDLDCLDIGSSTGGFVDCLLQHGAKRVIALDVGRSLLHEKLLKDKRVYLMENYNARYLRKEDLPFLPDFVTCDVSFISIKKIFPALLQCFKQQTEAVFLIKPQFEAGRKYVKKGILKDPAVHLEILNDFQNYFKEFNFNVFFTHSPIKGAKGNIEYLAYLTKKDDLTDSEFTQTDKIVRKAFEELYR